jgi:flagellar hook-associated protein 1 FlgK
VSNLLNSLLSSATALGAYDQVLQVTQNNVANASTPGYVKHRQTLLAMPFDPAGGLGGGVRAGEVQSARSSYADQSVRRQLVLLGQANQDVGSLASVQSAFDVSGDSGIPSALNKLFQSFSAWGQSPGDSLARQGVIDRASGVATAFQQTANSLSQTAQETEHTAAQAVDQINTLASQLRSLNQLARQGAGNDAGLDAQIHSTLEELSEYVSFSALEQDDGSVAVLLNGQTPLLIGDEQYSISCRLGQPDTPPVVYEGALPSLRLFASDGSDITAATTTGRLGSLLDIRNRVLPSYLGDAWQQGDLNRLAADFADRVNELLASGMVSNGPPPQPGIALFTYDANPTAAARSLTVDRNTVKPDLLGAIQTGPPSVSNGVPLALSALASPRNAADRIDGASYSQFFGELASRAGSSYNEASGRQAVQQSAVAQTKNLRQQMSGVSLDEEATILIQFQRAYEANSRLIGVLNQLTEDTLAILQR